MLVKVSHESLEMLASQLNETGHLAVPEGRHALFVADAAANKVISISGQTGELVPLYCTAHGKALLADLDKAELRGVYGKHHRLHRCTRETLRADSVHSRCKG